MLRGGLGEEVLIYSVRTGAGGETVAVVLGCVCPGVSKGGWMAVVVLGGGFSWGCICDPVLSARSVVKAWRIRPPALPTPITLMNSPPFSFLPGFQL